MDGAEVKQRLVARKPSWGFDALGMFFPFEHKEDAQFAADNWTEEFIRIEGGLAIAACLLVPDGVARGGVRFVG